jgi:hypothetical protein
MLEPNSPGVVVPVPEEGQPPNEEDDDECADSSGSDTAVDEEVEQDSVKTDSSLSFTALPKENDTFDVTALASFNRIFGSYEYPVLNGTEVAYKIAASVVIRDNVVSCKLLLSFILLDAKLMCYLYSRIHSRCHGDIV